MARGDDLSRREFIEKGTAATAFGLLLGSCSGGEAAQPDGGLDGGSETGPDGGFDGDLDGDLDDAGDADLDGSGPDCVTDSLPLDPYDDCRVVRVYDRRVTDYTFSEGEVCWQHVDVAVIRQMLDAAILELSREGTIEDAWAALLPGDLATARIAVKVNLNGGQPERINNSPAMMIALTESLIDAGATAENVTLFDVSRGFHEVYRQPIREAVSGVVLLGGDEVAQHDTERVEAPSMVKEDGSHVSCPVPMPLFEADQFINLHVMKGHYGGATGAMKNLFGLARNVWNTFHGRDDWGLQRYHLGRQCADLVTQPLIRAKSRLLISEGVYSAWWHADKPPDRFRNEDLFPDGMPCCLTVGRNPLYQDTVLYDLLDAERRFEPLDEGYDTYPDDWLRVCAEPPYEVGRHGHGRVVAGAFTASDLEFDHIDYRSFTTEV